jgi:hypothetical protein
MTYRKDATATSAIEIVIHGIVTRTVHPRRAVVPSLAGAAHTVTPASEDDVRNI